MFLEGMIRPESVCPEYKLQYFGAEQQKRFRISLPPLLDNIISFYLRRWLIRIPQYIAITSPFVVMWDYQWLSKVQIPGSQVDGLREYREVQLIILILRFFSWGAQSYIQDTTAVMWLTSFYAIMSAIVTPLHPHTHTHLCFLFCFVL